MYNKAPFVEQTLKSVLDQTVAVSHVFICDDGSTDGGREIAEALAFRHPSIIVLRKSEYDNKGISAARNRGLRVSRADLVAFLDADDWWEPDKLAAQVEILNARPDVGLVHCACRITDIAGATRRILVPQEVPQNSDALYDQVRLGTYPVTGSSSAVVLRRSVVDTVGPFAEDILVHEDWEMWSRVARVTGFAASDRVLVSIRELVGSHSRGRKTPTEQFLAKLQVLDRWKDDERFIDMAIPLFRSEATYWQVRSLRYSPISLLWDFWQRLRSEGGAVGRRLFPSMASYYLSIARLPLEVAKRAVWRLTRDAKSSTPRFGARARLR